MCGWTKVDGRLEWNADKDQQKIQWGTIAMADLYVFVVTKNSPDLGDRPNVFSTRAKAEAFVGPGGDSFTIDEVEFDVEDERVVRTSHVMVDPATDAVLCAYDDAEIKGLDYKSDCFTSSYGAVRRTIHAWSTVSREHALELAAAYKREKFVSEDEMRKSLERLRTEGVIDGYKV